MIPDGTVRGDRRAAPSSQSVNQNGLTMTAITMTSIRTVGTSFINR